MPPRNENLPPIVRLQAEDRTVWAVSSVDVYRAIAALLPEKTDVVCEIGAAAGYATILAAQRAHLVYAVEKAPEKLDKLKLLATHQPNVRILAADASQPPPQEIRADLLFVDIGGDAPPWRTLAVAERWAESLHSQRVVIRNTKLWRTFLSAQALPNVEAVLTPADEPSLPALPTPLLVERILELVSANTANMLAEALRDAGYRDRKHLREVLIRLGSRSLRPLVTLISDPEAPIAARRAAAEAVRGILREAETVVRDVRECESAIVRGVLGGQAAREAPDPPDMVRLLASEDALIRQQARKRLRRASVVEVKKLVEAVFRPVETVENVVKVLDSLGDARSIDPESVVETALNAPEMPQRAAYDRLVCAILGLGDQKWGKELALALESAASSRGIAHFTQVSALFSTIHMGQESQKSADLLRRAITSGIPSSDLRAALTTSPHPHVRALAGEFDKQISSNRENSPSNKSPRTGRSL